MKILNEMTGQEMFFLLAGPCVIEGEEMALKIAEHVSELTDKWGIPYVFKGSFKKANRSRLDSVTGIGDEKALKILAKIRKDFQIPVVTDIHSPEDAVMAAEYVDILQIPAFLCRQTDLLVAAAKTGRMVNIKKGQFLSPGQNPRVDPTALGKVHIAVVANTCDYKANFVPVGLQHHMVTAAEGADDIVHGIEESRSCSKNVNVLSLSMLLILCSNPTRVAG